jgi:hypothetical protein
VISKFKPGDWLLIAGGAAMLIFGLAVDWAEFEGVSGNGPFDYFFTGGLAWLLVVAAGVIAVLLAVDAIVPGTTPWSLILLLATGLATLLMLLRLILGAGDEAGFDLDRGAGMYIAFIAAAIAFAGAAMNYTRAGGKFSDLADMDKMRGAFKGSGGRGSTSAPPPPPPGAPPPPPPAP